ncbi:MAG: MFS transporter [Bryobacteraceae bacterium]|nr:MFS transporter [Bryobacteraceae bacterium]
MASRTPASVRVAPERPTKTRYWVIFYAVTLAIITYIDRVCISQAAPQIRADLGLTPVQMGMAFSAFAWAYALFEIPGGWLGDWIGPRKVLMRVVVMWSFFTAATGWVWNHISLLVVRFMFGAGEAGCFPNLTKAFTIWLPRDERVRAQGIMWLSARWGGAFTPLLVVLVFRLLDWRRAFELFGAIGIIWAIFFWRWFRDNPRDHKDVNAAELELLREGAETATGHGDVPWGRFLGSGTVWLLWVQYFCISYGWYFYITWLPTYLREGRNMEFGMGTAALAGLPLFFGGIGCLFSGFILGPITRLMGSPRVARRLMAMAGCLLAGLLLIVSVRLADPLFAIVAMALASFSNDLVMPPAWGACMDVGGKYAGTLSGSMNMMGNFAGGLAPMLVGYVLEHSNKDWALTFYISSAIYFVGMICWMFIDPVTPLDEKQAA